MGSKQGSPRYYHANCSSCSYLGRYCLYDLWICIGQDRIGGNVYCKFGEDVERVIVEKCPQLRFSRTEELEEFISVNRWYKVAMTRAIAKGLYVGSFTDYFKETK